MATPRQFMQGTGLALVPGWAELSGRTGAASSGAVTVNTSRSAGFTSITRSAQGTFTVTLDKYYYLMDKCHVWFIHSATTGVESWVVSTELSSSNSFVVKTFDSAGTAVDLPDGAILCLDIKVRTTRS